MAITSNLTIPPAPALNAAATQRALAAAGARSLIPLTYGVDRITALILNVLPKADDPNTLLVQLLWGHALDHLDEERLNDQPLPDGASISHYAGRQTTAPTTLVQAFAAQGITYADTLEGFAFSVLQLPTRLFDGQLNVSARLWGRRLYDPRKDSTAGGTGTHRLADPNTWEWNDCPSLALADWASNTLYGAGEAVDWASVPAAADANDALVGSPGEKRRIVGVTFNRDGVTVAAVGETLRAYAGCWLVPTGNGLRLLPDADDAPVASYSHAAGDIARLDAMSLRDMGNAPTAVEVTYTDTTQVPWREATATASLPGAGSTRPWRLSSVAMPGVQRYSQAYREAVERLNKLTLGDLNFEMEAFDIGIRHEPGDIVQVTHPLGLTDKPMRVTDAEMSSLGRWLLQLVEHDGAAYSNEVQTAPSVPDTLRVAPAGYADPVEDLDVAELPGSLLFAWSVPATNSHRRTLLQLHLGGDADTPWADEAPYWQGEATQHLVPWPADGDYSMLARHENRAGGLSEAPARVLFSIVNQRLAGITRTWLQSTGEPSQWLATVYDEFGEPDGEEPAWWSGTGSSLLIDTPQLEDEAAAKVFEPLVSAKPYPISVNYFAVLLDAREIEPASDCYAEVTAVVQGEANVAWDYGLAGFVLVAFEADDPLRLPEPWVVDEFEDLTSSMSTLRMQAATQVALARASYPLVGRFALVAGRRYVVGAAARGSSIFGGPSYAATAHGVEISITLIKK